MKDINFKVGETEILIKEVGLLKGFDKEVLSFLVKCKTKTENIHFLFYNSVALTEEFKKNSLKTYYTEFWNTKRKKSLIYDVLACIEMDYNAEDTNLKEFMGTYGYEYNEETEQLFNRVKEQKTKLHKVFTEEQIKLFDENENILKNFVENLNF